MTVGSGISVCGIWAAVAAICIVDDVPGIAFVFLLMAATASTGAVAAGKWL